MKPDSCASLRCKGLCDNCKTSHAVYYGKGIDRHGRLWRWEFQAYIGPVFITPKRGVIMKNQPGEKSPAWDVFEQWMKEREID